MRPLRDSCQLVPCLETGGNHRLQLLVPHGHRGPQPGMGSDPQEKEKEMTDDIVTLLRKYQPYSKLHGQAADEIERLREQNEYLKANVEMLLAEAKEQQ